MATLVTSVAHHTEERVAGTVGSSSLTALLGALDADQVLDVVDAFTGSVVERYEIEGPQLLVPEVRALREMCFRLAGRVGRDRRERLAGSSARQAGLLAYMSVNLDRAAEAESFLLEGAMFATAAKDRDLVAWVKGTQSFAAYYEGRYGDALCHARAGVQIAGGGPQRIRLLANGVARAAGKLGHAPAVDRATGEALDLAGSPSAADVLGPCIAFDTYSSPRAVANAATAYLSVGRHDDVLELTGRLEASLVRSNSDWSRALVGLDAASALARGGRDADHAATVGRQALADARINPIASIGRRATELADDLHRSGNARAADEFGAALRDWRDASGPDL